MLIALIIFLTLLELALKLSLVGIELSYQVGKRVADIKSRLDVEVAEASKSILSKTDKDTTIVENSVDTIAKASVTINNAAKTTMEVIMPIAKVSTKATILALKFVISCIRNLLLIFSIGYIVLEIVVFVLLTVVSYSYLSF